MSNIILIHIGDLLKCPPALNVLRLSRMLGLETIVFTTEDHPVGDYSSLIPGAVICFVGDNYECNCSAVTKFSRLFQIREQLYRQIEKYYSSDSLIWIVSDVSMKHVGQKIVDYRYVLHLMELSEELRYKNSLPIPKMDARLIGDRAQAVVVPSDDRAHIIQAWWGLKETPFVLHNKPVDDLKIGRNAYVHNETARRLIESNIGKKKILYQGITHKERPLYPFYQAVKELGEDYVLVTMGERDPLAISDDSKQHVHIPFVQSPEHLEITSWADIGILSYYPVKAQYSILNAVFCAPNKTFEYSRFGIPFLSNDIPGMSHVIREWDCGATFSRADVAEIVDAINIIESRYDELSLNSIKYYDSVNSVSEYKAILKKAGFNG